MPGRPFNRRRWFGWFRPNFITGMAVWYDPTRQSDADGAAIATLTDYSGNAKDANQATVGDRPQMVYNAQNGKKVARFDGGYASGDYMDAGDNLDLINSGYVMYVAVKPVLTNSGFKRSVVIGKGIASVAGDLGAYELHIAIDPSQPETRVYVAGEMIIDTFLPGPPYLQYQATFDETGTINGIWNVFGILFLLNESPEIYMNGTLKDTGVGTIVSSVASLDNSKPFNVGRSSQPPFDTRSTGDIGEILVYHIDSLSNDLRLKLDGYFCHKWGLGSSMDPAHPYYHYPP